MIRELRKEFVNERIIAEVYYCKTGTDKPDRDENKFSGK